MSANTRLPAIKPEVNATLPHFVDGNGRFAAIFLAFLSAERRCDGELWSHRRLRQGGAPSKSGLTRGSKGYVLPESALLLPILLASGSNVTATPPNCADGTPMKPGQPHGQMSAVSASCGATSGPGKVVLHQ